MLPLHLEIGSVSRQMIDRHLAEARQRRLVAQFRKGEAGQPRAARTGLRILLSRLLERARAIVTRPYTLEGTPADR